MPREHGSSLTDPVWARHFIARKCHRLANQAQARQDVKGAVMALRLWADVLGLDQRRMKTKDVKKLDDANLLSEGRKALALLDRLSSRGVTGLTIQTREERTRAIQEQSAATMDVREAPSDGEAVGGGEQGEEATGASTTEEASPVT